MATSRLFLRVSRRIRCRLSPCTRISRTIPTIMKRRIHQALKTRRHTNMIQSKSYPFTTKGYISGTGTSTVGLEKGFLHNSKRLTHGSNYNFVLSPELVGMEREAKRLHDEHEVASKPFNMAFDAAFERIPELRNQKELNILEIGFGGGACIDGIFNYFNNNNNNTMNNNGMDNNNNNNTNKPKVIIRGIDKEPWWLDYCNKKFSEEIKAKDLYLYKIDATHIDKLLEVNYSNFDIILFRFFLSHVMNFESVFKYMVRYLMSGENHACVIIQDGMPPNTYAGVASHASLLPHMSNQVEFPNLYQFIHEIVPPVMNKVMRFDVPYVLPGLIQQCGLTKVWENERVFGGVNGTKGFDMAVENLSSTVTRFKLLGYITDEDEKAILGEIDYARTLPESRSYLMMPMVTTVATKTQET